MCHVNAKTHLYIIQIFVCGAKFIKYSAISTELCHFCDNHFDIVFDILNYIHMTLDTEYFIEFYLVLDSDLSTVYL